MRRTVNAAGPLPKGRLALLLWHDDDAEVYLNGKLLLRKRDYSSRYEYFVLSDSVRQMLHSGQNVLAMHCASPRGGAHLDAGLYEELISKRLPAGRQTGVTVTATQTTYTFAAGPAQLKVNFLSPLLLDEIETVAWPVSYVTYTATASDGKAHPTQVLLTEAGTLASDTPY